MGGGGIKQDFKPSDDEKQKVVNISDQTDVVLFTPDAGRAEKDEYFIPNLHNGLFRIQAYLLRHGIGNEMICTDLADMDDVWKQIARYQPPIVGFSTYYNTMQNDLLNIEKAITVAPEALVVVGGFEASLNKQWLQFNDLIDIIVLGEGEEPLIRILEEIKRFKETGQAYSKAKLKKFLVAQFKAHPLNGVYVLGPGGIDYHQEACRISNAKYQEITLNAFCDFLHASPVESYWDLTRSMYAGQKDCFFRFVTSDHCPWKCKFCQSSIYYSMITGKKSAPVRYLEPGSIVQVLTSVSALYPYISHIYIDDENFLVNKKRAIATASLVTRAKSEGTIRKDMRFISRARTNNITSGICVKLKEAGWELLSVGSESYSQTELDFMNKKTTAAVNSEAIQTILESGLQVAENYILFTPQTTPETFYESAIQICANIIDYGVDGAATLFLTPLPGTQLWGDGRFELISDNPYQAYLPGAKKLFQSPSTGFEYLGDLPHRVFRAPGHIILGGYILRVGKVLFIRDVRYGRGHKALEVSCDARPQGRELHGEGE